MTIDEAIIRAREKAKKCGQTFYGFQYLQLAEWLEELQKRRSEKFTENRKSVRPDEDLPDAIPITMVTETFSGLEIEEEK